MKYISHRGNLDAKNSQEENTLDSITRCISNGFDVEIDIWCIDDLLYLGHDFAQQKVDFNFLEKNKQFLWIHAKNINCLEKLKDSFNCFWHQKDDYTLTSAGNIWVYPGKKLVKNCVAVMPEIANYDLQELKMCYGICSDNILKYRNIL